MLGWKEGSILPSTIGGLLSLHMVLTSVNEAPKMLPILGL